MNFDFGAPKKRRPNASSNDNTVVFKMDALETIIKEDTLDIENYTPSDAFMSPFQSSSVVDVMREVSGM
jgi:hypothetical protein